MHGLHLSACFRRDLTAVGTRRHFGSELVEQAAVCRCRDVGVPDAGGAAGCGEAAGGVRGRRPRGVLELVAADVILLFDDTVAAAVRLGVLGQVVGPREALPARRAREPLFAGVRTEVPLQLVATREPFAAEQPVADERPLAGVPAQVRLEVRRLAVDLAAAGHVADVLATSSW